MILVDSNILMYATGGDHPHKAPSIRFLSQVAEGAVDAAIDAELLQEVLHRYTSLNRGSDGYHVYARARILFPEVLPVTAAVMDAAKDLIGRITPLTARDAVHAAVCQVYELDGICSYDTDFDRIPGIHRITPR